MSHPIGERDLVEQTASKKPMALDSFGARFMLAGRRTKPSLRFVNCFFYRLPEASRSVRSIC